MLGTYALRRYVRRSVSGMKLWWSYLNILNNISALLRWEKHLESKIVEHIILVLHSWAYMSRAEVFTLFQH